MKIIHPNRIWDFTKYITGLNIGGIKVGDTIITENLKGKRRKFLVSKIEHDFFDGLRFFRNDRFFWSEIRLIEINNKNKNKNKNE